MPSRRRTRFSSRRVKNRSGGNQRTGRMVPELPANRILYSGPIRSSLERNEEGTHTVMLAYAYSLTSSSSPAVIAPTISNNPSSCANWSSFATVFDEYRVLGLMIKFFPWNRYSKVSTVTTPIYWVVDRNNLTALTGVGQATQYESVQQKSLEDPWSMSTKMYSVEEAQFLNTGSPASTYAFKGYATFLSNSTTYGDLIVYMRVQFRGTGV